MEAKNSIDVIVTDYPLKLIRISGEKKTIHGSSSSSPSSNFSLILLLLLLLDLEEADHWVNYKFK